jgi:hypothetical protein
MKKLDELVANSLNPYTIVRILSLDTKEQLDKIEHDVPEFDNNMTGDVVEIEISPVESIFFINRKDLITSTRRLKDIGVNFKVTNIVNEIFEMNSLDELLSKLDEETNLSDKEKEILDECFPGYIPQKIKAINIINSVFESNFGVDDVLDRISTKGSGSLNEFHKNLLK